LNICCTSEQTIEHQLSNSLDSPPMDLSQNKKSNLIGNEDCAIELSHSEFSNLSSAFPNISSFDITEEQLNKSFYTKKHPKRNLNNFKFELKKLSNNLIRKIECDSSIISKNMYFSYGKIFNLHSKSFVYVRSSNDSISIDDSYKLIAFTRTGDFIKSIEIGRISSPYLEKTIKTSCLMKGDTLFLLTIDEEVEDLIEEDLKYRNVKYDTVLISNKPNPK